MKLKWIFTSMILLSIISGCKKDELNTDSQVNGTLTAIITHFDSKDGIFTPDSGKVEGTVSPFGTLQEGSYWYASSYLRHDNENPPYIDYRMKGKLITANGDVVFYTQEGKMYTTGNGDGKNWIATAKYSGGTGKYKNVIGEGECIGLLTRNEKGIPVSVQMNVSGTISNIGQ